MFIILSISSYLLCPALVRLKKSETMTLALRRRRPRYPSSPLMSRPPRSGPAVVSSKRAPYCAGLWKNTDRITRRRRRLTFSRVISNGGCIDRLHAVPSTLDRIHARRGIVVLDPGMNGVAMVVTVVARSWWACISSSGATGGHCLGPSRPVSRPFPWHVFP